MPSITTAAKILQFGNCAPDNNPTAGNVRWITTRSGHVWKADEIPKCAADNNSRILPTAQIVLWITTCRPQKKVRIVRPITTIFLPCDAHRTEIVLPITTPPAVNCAGDSTPAPRNCVQDNNLYKRGCPANCAADNNTACRKLCRGFQPPPPRSGRKCAPDNNPARRRKKRRRCWNKRHSLK